jgi:uncharacterized membrane protein
MEKLSKIIQQREFQIFLFCLCVLAYVWPFLALDIKAHLTVFYVYLFTAWAAIILILFLISKSDGNRSSEKKKKDDVVGD